MNKKEKLINSIVQEEKESNNREEYDSFRGKQTIKNTPTVAQVCEALSEYLGVIVHHHDGEFFDDFKPIAKIGNNKKVIIYIVLLPRLITLIGRFYEGLKGR